MKRVVNSFVVSLILSLLGLGEMPTEVPEPNDPLMRVECFESPSIEVVETEFNTYPPTEQLKQLKMESWVIIRVCDLGALPARYEEFILCTFDSEPRLRLYTVNVVEEALEIKVGSVEAQRLVHCLKKIEQNPKAQYRTVAGALRDWLMGGSSVAVGEAVDYAVFDYLSRRGKQRLINEDDELYCWAERLIIPEYKVRLMRLSEALTMLNEIIEKETGRSSVIRYRHQANEPEMSIYVRRMSLATLLEMMVSVPPTNRSGARVIFKDGEIHVDHEFQDPHCCPRRW